MENKISKMKHKIIQQEMKIYCHYYFFFKETCFILNIR